jgi:hypothetical protein
MTLTKTGRCLEVNVVAYGSALAAATSTGATSLSLVSVADFAEEGSGVATFVDPADDVTEWIVYYTAKDEATNTLTLGIPLPADVDADTFLSVYPVSSEKVAQVKFDDTDKASPCAVHHSMRDRLAEGVREPDEQEAVEVTVTSSGAAELVNIFGESPVVDGTYISTPRFAAWLTTDYAAATSADEYLEDDDWTVDADVGGWRFGPSSPIFPSRLDVLYPDQSGVYLLTFGARWESSATGRREAFFDTYDSVTSVQTGGWRDVRPVDTAPGFSNLVTATVALSPTTGVMFGVMQNSGGALNLFATRTFTFVSLTWIGAA